MSKQDQDVPSPCIDICKYKLKKDRCIGCGMTERLKKKFKKMKGDDERLTFPAAPRMQQQELGLDGYWLKMYERKCRKKGVALPMSATA
jgi:hypothetical protein